jgi:hypothetical protein
MYWRDTAQDSCRTMSLKRRLERGNRCGRGRRAPWGYSKGGKYEKWIKVDRWEGMEFLKSKENKKEGGKETWKKWVRKEVEG